MSKKKIEIDEITLESEPVFEVEVASKIEAMINNVKINANVGDVITLTETQLSFLKSKVKIQWQ